MRPRTACRSSARSARCTPRRVVSGSCALERCSASRARARATRPRAWRPARPSRPPRARRRRGRRGSRPRPARRPAPCAVQAAARPRRRRRPSIRSSWTSVAMCTSSTATPAATGAAAPRPARRGTRARAAAACRRPRARRRRPPATSPGWPRRRPRGGSSTSARYASRPGRRAARRVLERARRRCSPGVKRDDRAAEQPESHLLESARSSSATSSSAPGNRRTLAGRYVYALPPGRTFPSTGTTRSNQSEKNGRRNPRGWVISRIASRPPGRSTRRSSASAALEIRDVTDPEADRRGVERAVVEGQREQVALRPT